MTMRRGVAQAAWQPCLLLCVFADRGTLLCLPADHSIAMFIEAGGMAGWLDQEELTCLSRCQCACVLVVCLAALSTVR